MDALRTLLLARTHVVVLDPDRVADAATRPMGDDDLEKFEDALAQLGFVMSLDLAMTIRRLPNAAIKELREWISTTLAQTIGAHRPHVPLFRAFPSGTPGDTTTLLFRRIISWLLTRADQPCPWCGETKQVFPLEPCGHLVCRTCWDGGNYAGCPICHRRVSLFDPFLKDLKADPVRSSDGQLRILHLAFDTDSIVRERFVRLVSRATPLSPEDRNEIETMIDTIGPRIGLWLPKKITVRETLAIVVARMWLIAPDRIAMRAKTAELLKTATDVLRVAVVLMGGSAGLADPQLKLGKISRSLRRTVLEALDAIDPEKLAADIPRHASLWKRVGERLHPYEHAVRLPNAALAFAIARGTKISTATFGATLTAQAGQLKRVRVERDRVHVEAWAAPIEDALRNGDARGASEHLAARPGELLRRADHLVRVAQAKQPEAITSVLRAITTAASNGAPATLLSLAAHVAKRGAPFPRRVFFPKAEVLHAWSTPDTRAPLHSDAIGAIEDAARSALLARAEARPKFPRGVIDRGLVDLLAPLAERSASPAKIAWPRGSETTIPPGEKLRLFLHWEQPANRDVDLDLSVAFYDENWRHVETCDFTHLVVDAPGAPRAAVHSGDLTDAPAPLGASEFVDLDLAALAGTARHAVMVVLSYNAVAFDKLPFGFAGLMVSPAEGTHFDPRAVAQRFDLTGKSTVLVPLTVDLAARRLRFLDVHIPSQQTFNSVGGHNVALAHIGMDFANLAAAAARPTLWDVAAIHAAARANILYVRERDGSFAQYRRRDTETSLARLNRLRTGEHDGVVAALTTVTAATWFAMLRDDLVFPAGSEGYILDARATPPTVTRLSAADLVAQLRAG
ncbi:MAG TPA: MXAN_6230/SCO0854 family RING domain-containing protein [Kofleriaceae bacterium]|jgi:hypothetical protein